MAYPSLRQLSQTALGTKRETNSLSKVVCFVRTADVSLWSGKWYLSDKARGHSNVRVGVIVRLKQR